jgi:hypothetical protein
MEDILELVKSEGDNKQWVYTCENGLEFECFVRRVKHSGHLCGYVTLTTDNDYFGVEYYDIPVDCHGGITYASNQGPNWVIGFDCAHYDDLQPFYIDKEIIYGENRVYRDMEFVTEECESICEQISEKSKYYKRAKKLSELI